MPKQVDDEQFDAVIDEMFGPDPDDDEDDPGLGDDDAFGLDDLEDDAEAFGRRGGGGRGHGGRGRGGGWRRGRGRRGPHRHWAHRGPWFYPYWWWGYPTSVVHPPAQIDPDELAEEALESMSEERRRGRRQMQAERDEEFGYGVASIEAKLGPNLFDRNLAGLRGRPTWWRRP